MVYLPTFGWLWVQTYISKHHRSYGFYTTDALFLVGWKPKQGGQVSKVRKQESFLVYTLENWTNEYWKISSGRWHSLGMHNCLKGCIHGIVYIYIYTLILSTCANKTTQISTISHNNMFPRLLLRNIASWWLNQPNLKNMLATMHHFPRVSGLKSISTSQPRSVNCPGADVDGKPKRNSA